MNTSGVYAILASISIIISIVLAMLLVFHPPSFIVLLALYILAISIYGYVYFRRNPKNGDINYDVNKLIAIFNIGLGSSIVLLGIIVPLIRGTGHYSSPSRY